MCKEGIVRAKTLCPLIMVGMLLCLTLACGFPTPTPLAPAAKTADAVDQTALPDLTPSAQVTMEEYKESYLIKKTGESRRSPGILQMQSLRRLSDQFG